MFILAFEIRSFSNQHDGSHRKKLREEIEKLGNNKVNIFSNHVDRRENQQNMSPLMPCILKVRIVEGRDLPIMDRSSALADAYVELRCGNQNDPQKTDIKRKTLNPSWNQDFRFDFPNEADLQDKPLDIRVWDYDVVSKNDMIGTVLIDLNCLLSGLESGTSQISGWFPIYDTLRGIRGELYVIAKLEIFQNANPFKDASAGVQFFSISTPFSNYRIVSIHQFVEELIVESDPEYHWTDTFRASRLSNFERQYLFYTLSGYVVKCVKHIDIDSNVCILTNDDNDYSKLRRQLGKKVLEMGGNAVLGYKQHFDLEGDSGIVARGYGTAVTLRKITESDILSPTLSPKMAQQQLLLQQQQPQSQLLQQPQQQTQSQQQAITSSNSYSKDLASSYSSSSSSSGHSSDSDTSTSSSDRTSSTDNDRPSIDFASDVQLLTLENFQSHLVTHIGGLVSTKSVKILKKSNTQEKRDSYWNEIRNEIKTHARSLGCNYIVGYCETTAIQQSEDLCLFSATGTAVVLDFSSHHSSSSHGHSSSLSRKISKMEDSSEDLSGSYKKLSLVSQQQVVGSAGSGNPLVKRKPITRSGSISGSVEDLPDSYTDHHIRRSNISSQTNNNSHKHRKTTNTGGGGSSATKLREGCAICHIPYPKDDSPFGNQHVKCAVCKKKYVPEIILASIDLPPGIPITGKGVLVQARVCRLKKKSQGDSNATILSENVPFIEYDLHNQIMYKLKVLGMNAAFGFKSQITFSDTLVIGVATATAVFLSALPAPRILHINRTLDPLQHQEEKNNTFAEIQKTIEDLSKLNHDKLQNAQRHHQPDTFERYNNHHSQRRGRSPAPMISNSESDDNFNKSHNDDSLDSSMEMNKSDSNNDQQQRTSNTKRSGSHKHHQEKESAASNNKKHTPSKKKLVKRVHNNNSSNNNNNFDTSSEDDDYYERSSHRKKRDKKKQTTKRRTGRANSLGVNESNNKATESEAYSLSSSYDPGQYTTEASNDDEMDTDSEQYEFSDDDIGSRSKTTTTTSSKHSKKKQSKRQIAVSKSSNPIRKSKKHHSTTASSSSDDEQVLSYPPERINEANNAFVVEIDDKIDVDKLTTLIDFYTPPGFSLCNTELLPGQSKNVTNVRLITAIRCVEWDVDSAYLNHQLSVVFNGLYDSIMFKLRDLAPCIIAGVNVDINIPEDDQIQMLLTAMCVIENEPPTIPNSPQESNNPLLPAPNLPPINLSGQTNNTTNTTNTNKLSHIQSISAPASSVSTPSSSSSHIPVAKSINSSPFFSNPININTLNVTSNESSNNNLCIDDHVHGGDLQFDMSPPRSPMKKSLESSAHNFSLNQSGHTTGLEMRQVELTPLSYLPKCKMERYLGRVNIHLIKESFSVRDNGGLGVFSHVFLTEANAILRAHVLSLGGNALVGYHIDEFNLILDSGPKGQAYSLISISGDAYLSSPISHEYYLFKKPTMPQLSTPTKQ
ncbi:C2 calcium-dependent membrane targeting domain-containing protein [Heterostelium album PN500]|uniref:C2 calcium-dependent membrane targeting domain-containing protein n=1 Tax=Heterostelium pallidum (strain ATCC 26659 / Pp 5 / PN500) TaxID=670386 RepID=D3BPB4_HETP5|nr:C2 calcium-dependent membrane targeting domain-containing protein [Heterostelium album PN500]EFA77124.1 C2 calcium-dependent membrane targeting domain-containing protein [Heterostelium album PN500]|eukprot:XP_020429253.1 C2 calcium-dependent membrane targeting domain-containing protein [Heterostelium album PN500]